MTWLLFPECSPIVLEALGPISNTETKCGGAHSACQHAGGSGDQGQHELHETVHKNTAGQQNDGSMDKVSCAKVDDPCLVPRIYTVEMTLTSKHMA